MKKRFTLVKKFKLLITALGLLFFSTISNAQVVHEELNDTKTITEDAIIDYYIDMNSDGVDDFKVWINQHTNIETGGGTDSDNSVYVDGVSEGSRIAVVSSTDPLAVAFNSGDPINSSNAWLDQSTLFSKGSNAIVGPYDVGNFKNSSEKFVGVIFVVDGEAHYGYIGINTTLTSFTVRDFAYEQKINTAIAAGAVNTSISPYMKSNSSIKNINNVIVAEFVNAFNGKMEIVNMNGQLVKSKTINGNNASLAMDGTPTGIYQVIVSGEEGFSTERIFVVSQ